MSCRKCTVSGRVQGVFYRDTTKKQAQSLGITGHAINLANGNVEVLMCGTNVQLNTMEHFLWQGSSWSEVTDIQCQLLESEPPDYFTTA